MKQKFSIKWRKSKQRRKQRKFRANAPLHIKQKMLSSNLSKELRKKYGKRSMPVIKNDLVIVMRGKFRKKKGKIMMVNLKKNMVYVEGVQKTKKDGSKINVALNPSNLQIQELSLEDKKRIKLKKEMKTEKGIREIKKEKKSEKEENK